MHIGIDLDEVIVDIHPTLIDFVSKTMGVDTCKEDYTTYRMWEIWDISKDEFFQLVFEYYKSDLFEKSGITPGAKKALLKLRDDDVKITFITSRPESTRDVTLRWFKRELPEIEPEIIFTGGFTDLGKSNPKSYVCKKIGAELLIDDCYEYTVDCSENGVEALLFTAPWNEMEECPELVTRVHGWEEIMTLVENKLQK